METKTKVVTNLEILLIQLRAQHAIYAKFQANSPASEYMKGITEGVKQAIELAEVILASRGEGK